MTTPNRRTTRPDLSAVGRLTPRDRQLCLLIAEHDVLTTRQVADVGFGSDITAQHRLTTLVAMDVFYRFRPHLPTGSAPYHYTMGPRGAQLVATEKGVAPTSKVRLRRRTAELEVSPRLRHLVGANGFFTSLIAHTRSTPGATLRSWWSEQRCFESFGSLVRPDGFGVYEEDGSAAAFFLEYDRGTETHRRLAAKLDGYRNLSMVQPNSNRWLLFYFESADRERRARASLRDNALRIATANLEAGPPSAAVWRSTRSDEKRGVSLPALAEDR